MANNRSAPSNLSTALLSSARDVLRASGLGRGNLLAAFSGGLDSLCLLRLLSVWAQEGGGRLEVAHVDHGLRPSSSDDARFCRETAAELGLPFHLLELRPGDFQRGTGIQAEARRHRRAFFERLLGDRKLDAVALGHHADDQAETILLRLIRGTGPRGIGGMTPWQPPYVRPLLEVRRGDLESLAREKGWAFREDPSNRNPRFLRNRVRWEVLPLLRTLNPSVEDALNRFGALASADDAWLSGEAQRAWGRLALPEPEGFRLPVGELRGLATPVRRRLYLAAWEAVGADPSSLESRHLSLVDELLEDGRPQRRAPIPGAAGFARCWADLWALRPDARIVPEKAVALSGPGRVALGVFEVDAVWGAPPQGVSAFCLPSGRPVGELTLRPRRAGDRLGGQKVKDLLMEARQPAWRRARTLVAEDRSGVVGILAPGFAAGLEGGGPVAPNQAIWLEERGEKRWCP